RFAHQLFGYDPGEMVGKSIQSFVPDRFAEVHLQHVADYLKEGESRMMGEHLDTAGKRKDGTEFRFRATLSMAKTPIGSLVTCVHRPIEEPESRQQ
ncbi:MAG TPA: PAS domain S-box protein, partial [Fimbriimonas sp.]|nr:PAS domain S-box protein [Fimbriimonas sp.]